MDSFRKIIDKATAELATLSSERIEIQSLLSTLRAEQATLDARAQARAMNLDANRRTVAQEQSYADRDMARSRLASGTLATGTATIPLAERLSRLETLQTELEEAEQQALLDTIDEQQRASEIQQEVEFCQSRLESIARERDAILSAKEQAHAELGQLTFRGIMASLVVLQEQLGQAEGEVSRLKSERASLVKTGSMNLSEWPEQQVPVKTFLPFEDEATRLIEQWLGLIAQLAQLPRSFEIERDALNPYYPGPILELFTLNYYEMNMAETLLSKFERMSQILESYRQYKQARL